MEKLKLKHLAGYLPYKLRGFAIHENNENVLLTGLGHRLGVTVDCNFTHKYGFTGKNFGIGNFKPILRPLSDLTKEIEHNGEKFVALEKLKGNGIYHYPDGFKIYLD